MNYKGIIIEESLEDKSILAGLKIIKTKVEKITPRHKTPWLTQWTLHTVAVPDDESDVVARQISKSIDKTHESSWYADFKNKKFHYIIFRDKIFKVSLTRPHLYKEAQLWGSSLGIPSYQMDWEQSKR